MSQNYSLHFFLKKPKYYKGGTKWTLEPETRPFITIQIIICKKYDPYLYSSQQLPTLGYSIQK